MGTPLHSNMEGVGEAVSHTDEGVYEMLKTILCTLQRMEAAATKKSTRSPKKFFNDQKSAAELRVAKYSKQLERERASHPQGPATPLMRDLGRKISKDNNLAKFWLDTAKKFNNLASGSNIATAHHHSGDSNENPPKRQKRSPPSHSLPHSTALSSTSTNGRAFTTSTSSTARSYARFISQPLPSPPAASQALRGVQLPPPPPSPQTGPPNSSSTLDDPPPRPRRVTSRRHQQTPPPTPRK